MLIHRGTVTLITDRLVLRKFAVGDAQDMFNNWVNDTEVCKFLTWSPHGTIETTKNILSGWINGYSDNNYYNWAIEYKGHVIGSISVIDYKEKHLWCEVGYCLGKDYWGKGIMTEALKAVIEYLFTQIGFNRIMAKHDTKNISSGKVMQKSGMTLEGTMRQVKVRKDGTFGDLNIYAILKEEYTFQKTFEFLETKNQVSDVKQVNDLSVSQMLNMSYKLWEKHKDTWSPMQPEYGRNFILYMIEEIGESIAIIKKKLFSTGGW